MPEFCPKCGGLMVPKELKTTTTVECRACGHRRAMEDDEKIELKEEMDQEDTEEVVVMEKNVDMETLPTTQAECPECGNDEAKWWMQQTRSGDEPPTRFLACTECEHRWREYD